MDYKVNYLLLEQLPKLYPDGPIAFYRSAEIPQSSWDTWVKNRKYRLIRIIEICNKLSIPFECFISKGSDANVIPSFCELFRDKDEFIPIHFNIEAFNALIIKRQIASEISNKLNIGRSTLYLWLNNNSSNIVLEKFIEICNYMEIIYTDYITTQDQENKAYETVEKLREHNRKLLMRAKRLADENKILQAEKELLQNDKEKLLAILENATRNRGYLAAEDELIYNV